MTSLTEFFNKHEDDALKGISHKNSIIKRNIIAYMAVNGECTLSELTKELHISVPTITKLVQELVDENIVTDLGKVETPGGRRPNIFGLANSAIYFAGVNVGRDNMTFLITDLQNNIIKEEYDYTFELQDRPQCFERICSNIENFIATCGIDRGKILGLGVCMTGRVNPDTGRSYKYFTSSEQSLREVLEERVGLRVLLENDTRARADALCRLGGFEPKTAMEFDQQMTAYLAGCSGAGITFVSSVLVSRLSPNPGICYYRLPEPESRRDIRLFWKRGRYKTRAMEAFLAMPPENGGEE